MVRWIAVLLALAVPHAITAEPPSAERIAVIVNPTRSADLPVSEVGRFFLRQKQFWPDGEKVVPINQPAGSEIRERFSARVCDADSHRLSAYWNQQYFHGVFPPATLGSDMAVKLFVARDRNAIGYVHAGAVDDTVRVAVWLP